MQEFFLSGGECLRLCILAKVVSKRSVSVCDEPFIYHPLSLMGIYPNEEWVINFLLKQ